VSDDQWEDLECLYKACAAARTDEGLNTDTGVDERVENEQQRENDCEMKTLAHGRSIGKEVGEQSNWNVTV